LYGCRTELGIYVTWHRNPPSMFWSRFEADAEPVSIREHWC
jgi:hypothetical protein